MAEKTQPIGICDHCGGEIPEARHYTTKGTPRLYCSRDCRNTANSRAGAAIRGRKAKQRVQRGEWKNPAKLNPPTPEEQGRRARLGRKREVEAGIWRNPALSPEARRKLSRPRKHSGVLYRAMQLLSRGARMEELSDEQREAYRAYSRRLYARNRDHFRARARRAYRRRRDAMTEAQREEQRAKWRAAWRRRRDD